MGKRLQKIKWAAIQNVVFKSLCFAALSGIVLSMTVGCATQKTGIAELRKISAPVVSADDKKLGDKKYRREMFNHLESEYNLILGDLKTAMAFVTFRQRKDFFTRKSVSLVGVLLGITATTLNAASAANIVWSTAFTGAQTAATGYLSNDDGLIDPYSNQMMSKTKDELMKLHSTYSELEAKLRLGLENTTVTDAEWDKTYQEAYQCLQKINFECFSVVPQ